MSGVTFETPGVSFVRRHASAAFFTYVLVRLSLTVGASPSTVAGPTGNGRSEVSSTL